MKGEMKNTLRHSLLVILAACVFVTFAAPAAWAGAGTVTNPGFEDTWSNGWTHNSSLGGWTNSNATDHLVSGTYSGKKYNANDNARTGNFAQSVTGLDDDTPYEITVWMASEGATSQTCYLKVIGATTAQSTAVNATTTFSGFTQRSCTVKPSGGTIVIELWATKAATSPNASWWFDDVTIAPACTPPTPPGVPSIGNATSSTVDIANNASDSDTDYFAFRIGTQFVQASGALGSTRVFQQKATWGTKTVTGLGPNTGCTVEAKASAVSTGDCPSSYTASALLYTLAVAPAAPVVDGALGSSLNVNPALGTNPAATGLAITIGGGAYTLDTNWVGVDGSVGTVPVYQTDAAWGTRTVTGLAYETEYTFKVRARNGDLIETADSEGSTGTTTACQAVGIVTQPINAETCTGNTANFSVVTSGDLPTYQWQVDKGSGFADCVESTDGTNTTSATMTTSTTALNGYQYRCYLTNCGGTNTLTSDAAMLTVNPYPDLPVKADAADVSATSITWNWSAASGADSYKLWDAATGGAQIGGTIATNTYVESKLAPGTAYSRWVEAVNGCGPTARVALDAVATTSRPCPANAGFEGTYVSNLAPEWVAWGTTPSSQLQEGILNHTSDGSKSQGVAYSGASYEYGIYQQVNATNGSYYNLSVWSAGSASNGGARISVDTLGRTDGSGDVGKQFNPPAGSFTQRYVTPYNFMAQSNVITILCHAARFSAGSGGWIYFDDVQLSPGITGATINPGNPTVCAGTSATFGPVSATSSGAMTYQWQVSSNGGSSYSNVSGGTGADTSTYVTAAVTPAMNGYLYRCVVTGEGDCGASVWSNAGTLTVNAPVITTQPVGGAIFPGLSMTLTIEATGTGTLHYQWKKDGGSVGTDSPSFVASEAGSYVCEVTDDCAYPVPSNAAVVRVVTTTPTDAKAKSDTETIDLAGCVVTAAFGDAFYVQLDMTTGLRIESTALVSIGDLGWVTGTMGTNAAGERFLTPTAGPGKTGTGSMKPAGMITRAIGGGDSVVGYVLGGPGQMGVTGGQGTNNVSLLIRLTGKVTQVGTDYFYVNDGADLKDGTSTGEDENVGVRIRMALPTEMATGDMVAVTGICRLLKVDELPGSTLRSVVPLSADDVVKQ